MALKRKVETSPPPNLNNIPNELKNTICQFITSDPLCVKSSKIRDETKQEFVQNLLSSLQCISQISKEWDSVAAGLTNEMKTFYLCKDNYSNGKYYVCHDKLSWNSLENLSMDIDYQNTRDKHIGRYYHSLSKLVIENVKSVRNAKVLKLIAELSKTCEADNVRVIWDCEYFLDDFLGRLSLIQKERMKTLELVCFSIRCSILDVLDMFPNLSTFRLGHSSSRCHISAATNPNDLKKELPQYKTITHFTIKNVGMDSSKRIIQLSLISQLFPNLKSLVYHQDGFDSEVRHDILSSSLHNINIPCGVLFENLEYLNIDNPNKKNLDIISQRCPKLCILVLRRIPNDTVQHCLKFRYLLSLYNTSIKYLRLEEPDGERLEEKSYFLSNIKSYQKKVLEKISLQPSNITNINTTAIKELDIRDITCTINIFYALEKFPNLKKIYFKLTTVGSNNNKHFQEVSRNVRLPNITYLDVAYTTYIKLLLWKRLFMILPNASEIVIRAYKGKIDYLIRNYPNISFSHRINESDDKSSNKFYFW